MMTLSGYAGDNPGTECILTGYDPIYNMSLSNDTSNINLVILLNNDGSSLSDWTVYGATINTSDGVPPPCLEVQTNQYAYINPGNVASLLNTIITLNIKVISSANDLCDFYFACDSSGAGQMLRLESRSQYNSGFAATINWTTWYASSTQPYVAPDIWYNIKIIISSTGYATWYLNDTIMDSNWPLIVQGNYIGIIGDGGAGGLFDNIVVKRYYALNELSSSALSSMRGIYSTKLVLSSYTGPILRLNRSTDNAVSDFYADYMNNLYTGINGTGTSFVDWVGGGTAYVEIWYDQSDKKHHAIQTIQSCQPQYNDSLKLLDFSTNLNNQLLALPDGTFPTGDSSYTITLKHGTMNNGANGFFGSGTPGLTSDYNDKVLAFDVYGGTGSYSYYNLYWWGDDMSSTTMLISVGNILTNEYTSGAGPNSRKIYVNGSLDNEGTPNHIRESTPYNNYIGCGDIQNKYYFNGQLYYFSIFSSPLSDADRAIVESQ